MTAAPGQPTALYARWFRVISADASDETVARSWELGGASDRKFWTELDAEPGQLRERLTLLAAEWDADAAADEKRVRPTQLSETRARVRRDLAACLRKALEGKS